MGCRRQVRHQRRQLAAGAGRQGGLHPLVQLLGGQPAIAGGTRQDLDDPVPILMGCAQVTTWDQLTAGRLGGRLIGHGQTVRRCGRVRSSDLIGAPRSSPGGASPGQFGASGVGSLAERCANWRWRHPPREASSSASLDGRYVQNFRQAA